MRDFNNVFTYSNGQAFPATKAVDSSGGGAKDGTEYKAAFVDEILGFMQAAVYQGGLVPSGASDSASDSQVLEGIRRGIAKTDVTFATLELWKQGVLDQTIATDIPFLYNKVGNLITFGIDMGNNAFTMGLGTIDVEFRIIPSVPYAPEIKEGSRVAAAIQTSNTGASWYCEYSHSYLSFKTAYFVFENQSDVVRLGNQMITFLKSN